MPKLSTETVEPQSTSRPPETPVRGENGVTVRVVVLSLILAVVFGFIIPHNDSRFSNTFLGGTQLPIGAIGVLLGVVLCNMGLRLFARRYAFSRKETLTIYIASIFACLATGRSSAALFVNVVIGPFYYATRENGWLEFLQPHLQPWLTPAINSSGELNHDVINNWYLGNALMPWQAWLIPLVTWGVVLMALYMMFACLSTMLRAQWADHEVLAFPLLRLPLELTEGMDAQGNSRNLLPALFQNPLLWIGVGIAVFMQGMNGLNMYFPDVPTVPLGLNMQPMLTEAPWNQIGAMQMRVMPYVIGIAFLLNTEVSLSVWVFYLLHKAEYIGAYSLGYLPSTMPNPIWTRGISEGFISYQSIGAYFAYAGVLVWMGRRHYHHILRRALGREAARTSEKEEALSYPVAFWGFTACSCFLLGWTIMAGVHPFIALMMWVTYFVIILVLTRTIAEAGLNLINHGWSPLLPFANMFGGGPGTLISPATAVPATQIQTSLMVDLKGLLLPCFVQGFKLAQDRKIALRPLLALVFAVTIVSSVVGLWTSVVVGYQYGGLRLDPWLFKDAPNEFATTVAVINKGIQPDLATNGFWFGVGAFTLLSLIKLRALFTWFPLHPIGYLMWAPYSIAVTWFSFFLGWFVKTQIIRFGGHDMYRRVTPLFLGLILGDIGMMLFWLIIDTWQGRTFHNLVT